MFSPVKENGSENNRSLYRVPFSWIHQTNSEGMTLKMTYYLTCPPGQMSSRDLGKITQYVDCVTKKLWSIPAFAMNSDRIGETYSELDNINIPTFVI